MKIGSGESWPPAEIEILTTHWGCGKSALQIAEIIGPHRNRNMVISKAHRLGLASKDKPHVTNRKPRRTKAADAAEAGLPHPILEPEIIEEVIPENLEPVSLLMLTPNVCRWPIGQPGETSFGFCGLDVGPRLRNGRRPHYCRNHRAGAGRGFGKWDKNKLAGWIHKQDGVVSNWRARGGE